LRATRLYKAAVEILPGAVGAVISIAMPLELDRLLELLNLELLDLALLSEDELDVWIISPALLEL